MEVEMVSRRWHAHPLLLTEIPTQAHLPEISLGRSQESPNPTPGSLGKGWLYSCLSSPRGPHSQPSLDRGPSPVAWRQIP